jgi:hypothetical protein
MPTTDTHALLDAVSALYEKAVLDANAAARKLAHSTKPTTHAIAAYWQQEGKERAFAQVCAMLQAYEKKGA